MKVKSKYLILLSIIVSFGAAYMFPGVGDNVKVQDSITFIGILFGLIIGFFIADLYSRYQAIRQNAAADSSCLVTFYLFAKIITKETGDTAWLENVKDKITNYIHRFMPLPWEKYGHTQKEFADIGKTLEDLKYSGEKANETYSNILNVYNQHANARENLVMFGQDKLSWGEWLTVIFLGVLLLGSLFYIKDSSLVSIIFTGAITSAILILFIVVSDLNNLNFGENAVSVEPYERVLDAIEKPRFYSKNSQKSNN